MDVMAAVRGAVAGHGKSGAPLTTGCFLLVLMVVMVTGVDKTSALTTSRQPDPALGVLNVKFRGARSAFMHPTATSFSPPIKNNNNNNAGRRSQGFGGGSITSSLMPPGVASRAPSTRVQESDPDAPAPMPPAQSQRPHTWASGAANHPQQPTFVSFGMDAASAPRPAMWNRPQASGTAKEGGGGWAGMDAPAVQGRRASLSGMAHPRPHLTAGLTGPDPGFANYHGRLDTYGLDITEDLSHLNDRPSGRWNPGSRDTFPSSSSRGSARDMGSTNPVISRGFRPSNLWPTGEEDKMVVEDEGVRSILDINSTSEYPREDYVAYHDYDQGNHSWKSPEDTPSTTDGHKALSLQHVVEIMNLATQAELHALLEQRGITFQELKDFLNSGKRKKDVLEFLKPASDIATITTTSPPELSPGASSPSVVEEGYQGDVTGRVFSLEDNNEGEDGVIEQESKEQTKKNRKKGRRGKEGRRGKNKRRKGKKRQREDTSSSIPPMDNTTSTADPEPWVPSTSKTLPEVPLATTTAATIDTQLSTTQPPVPDTMVTSPPSVRASEVTIMSVTLVEAPSDPYHRTPDKTTFVEDATPNRRHSTLNKTHPWEDRTLRKFPRPVRPSREPEQTVNEIEKVNFVQEEQRHNLFPLRGLLIISGLMGALTVFTLVILITYAVIKCSKKPAVNNYQVSEQQKPAGT